MKIILILRISMLISKHPLLTDETTVEMATVAVDVATEDPEAANTDQIVQATDAMAQVPPAHFVPNEPAAADVAKVGQEWNSV